MPLNRNKIRKMIFQTLNEVVSKTEKIKEIQRIIGAKDDGKWGPKTDRKWYAWCKENAFNISNKFESEISQGYTLGPPSTNIVNIIKSGDVKEIKNLFSPIIKSKGMLSFVYEFVLFSTRPDDSSGIPPSEGIEQEGDALDPVEDTSTSVPSVTNVSDKKEDEILKDLENKQLSLMGQYDSRPKDKILGKKYIKFLI